MAHVYMIALNASLFKVREREKFVILPLILYDGEMNNKYRTLVTNFKWMIQLFICMVIHWHNFHFPTHLNM